MNNNRNNEWSSFTIVTYIDQAFAGGFIYGLSMDYPMNLSIALGINVGWLGLKWME